jgi:hypothetical protein
MLRGAGGLEGGKEDSALIAVLYHCLSSCTRTSHSLLFLLCLFFVSGETMVLTFRCGWPALGAEFGVSLGDPIGYSWDAGWDLSSPVLIFGTLLSLAVICRRHSRCHCLRICRRNSRRLCLRSYRLHCRYCWCLVGAVGAGLGTLPPLISSRLPCIGGGAKKKNITLKPLWIDFSYIYCNRLEQSRTQLLCARIHVRCMNVGVYGLTRR